MFHHFHNAVFKNNDIFKYLHTHRNVNGVKNYNYCIKYLQICNDITLIPHKE